MAKYIGICCLCFLVLSAGLVDPPIARFTPVGPAPVYAQATDTELMQQSDHHRRTTRAKKAQAEAESEERQIAAFGVPETASRNYDYLILVLLAVSLVILTFVTRRDRRARLRR
jgi:hypothetical protein